MRDIIWTIIVVWFIYKIVDVLRSLTSKKTNINNSRRDHTETDKTHYNSPQEKDIKKAVKNHLNNEGEYVDFEEMK